MGSEPGASHPGLDQMVVGVEKLESSWGNFAVHAHTPCNNCILDSLGTHPSSAFRGKDNRDWAVDLPHDSRKALEVAERSAVGCSVPYHLHSEPVPSGLPLNPSPFPMQAVPGGCTVHAGEAETVCAAAAVAGAWVQGVRLWLELPLEGGLS